MTGIFAFYKNNFKFFQKNSFTSQKFYYLCPQIATMLHQKTIIMQDFYITIERESKTIKVVYVKAKSLRGLRQTKVFKSIWYNFNDIDKNTRIEYGYFRKNRKFKACSNIRRTY